MANPDPSPATRFTKGISGNPGGRPRTVINLINLLNETLAEVDPQTARTKAKELVNALVAEAITGSVRAAKEVLDRVHGSVQPIQQEHGTLVEVAKLVRERLEARENDDNVKPHL